MEQVDNPMMSAWPSHPRITLSIHPSQPERPSNQPPFWQFGALSSLQMQRRTAQEVALRSDAALPVGEATEFHAEEADTGFALWTEALNAKGAAS